MVLPGQETPVFRAGVTLVRVDAQVVERGRAVTDLAAADFEVFDDGRPRRIAHFGREAEPLDLVLLLDVSGSMHRFLGELATTAQAALAALHEDDRAAVMLFARRATVREEFTADFAEVAREMRTAVNDQSLGGGTTIYASIIAASEYLAKQPRRGRRAVLIVTDNLSLNYRVTDEDVIRALYGADTVLNAILIGRQMRPDAPRAGVALNPDFIPSDVFRIAEQTGGEALESRKVGESFRELIERIRARYAIQYEAPPSAPGALHRVEVKLAGAARKRYPRATVRARAGYYAAP